MQTYEAIAKGENIPEPGIPESFKVLIKELQSMALDVRVLNENNEEVELKEVSEYEEKTGISSYLAVENRLGNENDLYRAGFSEERVEGANSYSDDSDSSEDEE